MGKSVTWFHGQYFFWFCSSNINKGKCNYFIGEIEWKYEKQLFQEFPKVIRHFKSLCRVSKVVWPLSSSFSRTALKPRWRFKEPVAHMKYTFSLTSGIFETGAYGVPSISQNSTVLCHGGQSSTKCSNPNWAWRWRHPFGTNNYLH